MFKKLVKSPVIASGRLLGDGSTTKSYFNIFEWRKWLKHVSNFYKTPFHNNEILPLFSKKVNDNRPYISVRLFDRDITVLLDSGATTSIIGNEGLKFLNKLKIKVHPIQHSNLYTADGKEQKVIGLVDLPISIGTCFRLIKALVVPSVTHSFIFGMDFVKSFNLIMNFKNNSYLIQNDSIKLDIVEPFSNSSFSSNLFSLDDLSPFEKNEAFKVLELFKQIDSDKKLGRTNKIKLTIDTGDNQPFKKKPYLLSPYMQDILNKELDSMLELGVVEESNSPWSSPTLLVKKSNGEYRFCFDGRFLNAITKHDSFPLPHVDRILCNLRNAKFISSIDLRKAFWQIPLDEASKEKTAFSIIGRGHYQFNVVPFGLCNAAQTQQRLVDSIFGPKYEPHIFSYLDDILICSPTFEHHIELLKTVQKLLKEAGLTINLEKCNFFKTTLKYLGFIVGNNSLATDPAKVESMTNYPRPQTSTEVKRFIGMCSWYRRFIKDFSSLVNPLNALLKGKKKKQTISWNDDAEAAFLAIKQKLVSAPVLSQPDFSQKFFVQSDASDVGIGGMLTQFIDGEEKVIAYASRSLSKAERNYSVTERECLAVIFCIEKFRPWIEGTPFTVITDHYSLLWLNNLKTPSGKLSRWLLRLRQHTFDLQHRKGSMHLVPDALSRIPYSSPDINLPEAKLSLLSTDNSSLDPWYISLRDKIQNEPDKYPQWRVKNEKVYKFISSNKSHIFNKREWKILVPKCQRNKVIDSCHIPPTSAHFGFRKTLYRVQETYYWPNMRSDILKFIRKCLVCGAQKCSNLPKIGTMGKEKIVDLPGQILSLDFVGPFPRSKKGNKWLLVAADWFSKYTYIFPLKHSKSNNIVDTIENNIFLIFGVPQILITDNAPNFASNNLKGLCEKYKVKQWFTPYYSPQCNFVERNNKTITTAIRCYIDKHEDWDLHIPQIRQAINTAVHEVTGFPPTYLMFGRHVPISGEYYDFSINDQSVEILPGDRNTYAENLTEFRKLFVEIRNKLHSAYERNLKSYNLRKRDVSFNVGDKVWRVNKVLSNAADKFAAKLSPKYILSIVCKKLSHLVYELKNTDGSKAGKWHVKDLLPYHDLDDSSDEQD